MFHLLAKRARAEQQGFEVHPVAKAAAFGTHGRIARNLRHLHFSAKYVNRRIAGRNPLFMRG